MERRIAIGLLSLLVLALVVVARPPRVLPAQADGTPTNWTRASIGGPSHRACAQIVYDSTRHRVVLFGGITIPVQALNDTWEWDGTSWTQVHPTTSPPSRGCGGMAYDSARQRVVLFGGDPGGLPLLSDTWEYDGSNWTQITPAISPSARNWVGMGFDAASARSLLFGGDSSNGGRLGDTWSWDGTSWTQLQPAASPPARGAPAFTYDSGRQAMVMFGGLGESGRVGDTWEWNGTTWTQSQPASTPPPRWGASLTYDAGLGVSVLFGGDYLTGSIFGPNDETWEWDGIAWTQRWTTDWPRFRLLQGAAYDATRDQVVIYGGIDEVDNTFTYGDTWAYGPQAPGSAGAAPRPHHLNFPGTGLLTASPPQPFTLTNYGDAPTTITSITATGDADVAGSDCPLTPATLAPGASCTVDAVFLPTAVGNRTGHVVFSDDAGTGTQTVDVYGYGQNSHGTVQPAQLGFGDQPVGTTSAPQTVSVGSDGGGALGIISFDASGPFQVTNLDCPIAPVGLPLGQTCHVAVTFSPDQPGPASGTLTVTHAGWNNPSTVALTGTGA